MTESRLLENLTVQLEALTKENQELNNQKHKARFAVPDWDNDMYGMAPAVAAMTIIDKFSAKKQGNQ